MQFSNKRKTSVGYKIGFCLLLFITFCLSAEQVMAFEFDGFQSGSTLKQIFGLAQQRDLGIIDGQKYGIPSAHFNANLFKETSKIMVLTYHTDLLDERVSIDLHFTPQTKRLFSVKSNLKTTPKYLEGLTSVLDKKHGAHKKSFGVLLTLQNSTVWNVDERTEIKIVKYMGLYRLEYTDPRFFKLNEQEKVKVALVEKKDLQRLNDDKL